MTPITTDDLRAAVQAGHLSEAQAARLATLAQARAGIRDGLGPDDEPFELFRGFAEIFIAVGLLIGLTGMVGLAGLMADPAAVAAIGAVLCLALAWYFTRVRRMVLPSIVLVCGFALAVLTLATWWLTRNVTLDSNFKMLGLTGIGMTAASLAAWYALFRLPFTMLLIGLCGLAAVFVLNDTTVWQDWTRMLDLTGASGLGTGVLVFGMIAALAGLAFDMRDPHRLGRASASAFWLHLLAAPAIVNTLAITAMNADSPAATYAGLAAVLALVTLIALILDRRSFLTAGLGYLAWLIWALTSRNGAGLDWPAVLVLIGAAVTALGAWWTGLRAALMRLLPEFPGKHRLPPYEKGDL
ncbi:hypothetical protein [Paracoccus jiaweipingae]|uniref:hypothetical protein n=1 Tax=unclassified Paracoccus (in: a-proteobacteria) TaxID=2688777 RepID=UPI00379C3EA0